MSIFIQNNNGHYRLATDTDLANRGYHSTQSINPIPTTEIEVWLDPNATVAWSQDNSKVKAIKIIRETIKNHYRYNGASYGITPPTQQKGFGDNIFGLKHIKWLVEGVTNPSESSTTTIRVSSSCFAEIQKALSDQNITVPLTVGGGRNNLDRLKEHRERLIQEINKIDDLIAWQLYS